MNKDIHLLWREGDNMCSIMTIEGYEEEEEEEEKKKKLCDIK
jgi:hypothetical protein